MGFLRITSSLALLCLATAAHAQFAPQGNPSTPTTPLGNNTSTYTPFGGSATAPTPAAPAAAPAKAPGTPPKPAPQTFVPQGSEQAQLVLAATAGNADEALKLVALGVNPDATFNGAGVPVLALVANRPDDESLRLLYALLDSGANPNIKDASGQTALFYAAKRGNIEAVQLLLERGADANIVSKDNITARTLAHRQGHPDVVKAMDEFTTERAKAQAYGYQKKTVADAKPKKDEPAKLSEAELKNLRYELIFNACAVQYWEYTLEAKMETEYGTDGPRNARDAHQKLADTAFATLRTQNIPSATLQGLISGAQSGILGILNKPYYASNAHRRADGIGNKPHMKTKCEEVTQGLM